MKDESRKDVVASFIMKCEKLGKRRIQHVKIVQIINPRVRRAWLEPLVAAVTRDETLAAIICVILILHGTYEVGR